MPCVGFPHVATNVERWPTGGLDHEVDDELARLAAVVGAGALPEVFDTRIGLQAASRSSVAAAIAS